MSPTADQLRRPAAFLGLTGAALLVAAGLIQTMLGAVIPDWTGDKPAPVGLGLLTVGMGAGTLLGARWLRSPDLSPGDCTDPQRLAADGPPQRPHRPGRARHAARRRRRQGGGRPDPARDRGGATRPVTPSAETKRPRSLQ
jgi:hypothetical protein